MRKKRAKPADDIESLLKIANLEPPKDKSLNPLTLKKAQSNIMTLERYQRWVAATVKRILKAANPDFRDYLLSEGQADLAVLVIAQTFTG